jgi:inorganic pyrophosphatase
MYIISVGRSFNDIDAFGCALAYAELLRAEGQAAQVVFLGPLNNSVTPLALAQSNSYLTSYELQADDRVIYVDISSPEHLAFPDHLEQTAEIYDHHYGFEAYWQARIGSQAHIERVGAAATLIWEEFKKRGLADQISASSTNLLALAILQNTLNFTSSETVDRDRLAFEELTPHLTLPAGWPAQYFQEFALGIHQNFQEALRNDTKITPNYFADQTLVFSQLEISEDPVAFLARYQAEIDAYWAEFQNKRCLVNIPDMASKTSVLYSDDPAWLHTVLEPLFPEVLESTPSWIRIPLHQRKQILKLMA